MCPSVGELMVGLYDSQSRLETKRGEGTHSDAARWTGKRSGLKSRNDSKQPVKIDLPLSDKLPGYHVCLGLAFFGLGIMAKQNLPQAIGSLPVIQLPCAFFSAVLIPFGSLLALRGLIVTNTSRNNLLSYHLGGLVFLIVMLSTYFYTSLIMNGVLELPRTYPKTSLSKSREQVRLIKP